MKLKVPTFVNTTTGRNVKTATATPTGIKIGSKVHKAEVVLAMLPDKGARRKVRKQLTAGGFHKHAKVAVVMDRVPRGWDKVTA